MKDIIDEMQLPLVNPKEELESISTQKFLPLFDLKKFEIRPEPYRDKGIDHTIEVKKHEKHTNFRTIIQLKATESIKKNNDGSYSLQVYTYNIQYLLNGGIPAYYVLYIKEEDKFHFENLNSFVSHLNEKDTNWQKQKTHVLRFNNELDKSGIDDIYKETYRVGLFNRNIREKLVYKNATLDSGDRIHFDYDLNVTSDSEIREIIENIGLQLINEGRWNDVLLLHSKASTKVAKSALYNLVLGLANYYKANHFETLNFFKQALHLKHELSKELLNHLQFFNSTVRFGLGLIGGDEYDEIINSLKSDDNLALYIKLEEAKNRYISKVEGESYDTLMSDFQNIIEDGRATDNIILTVRSEKVLYSGSKNNMEYLRSVSIINSLEVEMGPLLKLRIDSANRMIEDQKAWLEEVKNLKKETLEKKNYFVFYLTTLNEVKVMYEYEVYTDHVEVEAKIQGYEVPQKPDNRPIFSQMILRLDQACSFYNEIGHFENRSAAQSTKYEILHYIKEYDKAKELLNHLYDMAEINEMRDFKKKLDILANRGTIHERLEDMISEMVERSDFEKEEWSKMIKEMEEMDLGDKEFRLDDRTEYNTIHLFPIGYFQFPERDKDEVLEILNATEDAINQIKNLWNLEIIPVANIYNEEISEEGPQNGTLADSGLSSRRNIYRIRKEFKRKGFPRVIINM